MHRFGDVTEMIEPCLDDPRVALHVVEYYCAPFSCLGDNYLCHMYILVDRFIHVNIASQVKGGQSRSCTSDSAESPCTGRYWRTCVLLEIPHERPAAMPSRQREIVLFNISPDEVFLIVSALVATVLVPIANSYFSAVGEELWKSTQAKWRRRNKRKPPEK